MFLKYQFGHCSVQFSSVTQSCPTLCDPMDQSTPGLPAHHQLLEFTQTHVHWVSDAIQPSHVLASPSPPAIKLSHHQGLFKWVSSSHQVAKVLEFHESGQDREPGRAPPRLDFLPCLPFSQTPRWSSVMLMGGGPPWKLERKHFSQVPPLQSLGNLLQFPSLSVMPDHSFRDCLSSNNSKKNQDPGLTGSFPHPWFWLFKWSLPGSKN